jgi:hypothetical protein
MKRILGLAAAAAIVATGGFAAVAPASAAHTATTVAPASNVVSATPAAAGDLRTGDTLRLFVTIDESSGAGVISGTASVTVDRNPVTSRSGLAGWFAGTSKTITPSSVVTTEPTPVVAAGVTQTMTVAVPAANLHLGNPGVYAVDVNIRVGGKSIGASHTAVAWNLESSKAVPVAVAAPLTVPASSATLLSANTLELDTAPGGVLTDELNDLSTTPFAIGIDPRIIASIRVLGKSAPASAMAWLLQLQSLPNQTFPLAWADSDVAAGLQAGKSTVLTPKSLDFAIDPSLFNTSQQQDPTPSATPTSDPSDPTLPTNSSLTSWTYTMPKLSWPVENSLISTDIPKLTASGITGAILSSTNVKAASGSLSSASGTISGTAVAVSDASMSQYLRDAVAATSRSTSNAAMTRLVTMLGLVSHESGSSTKPVLLTLGRDWESADASFDRVATALTAHPWMGTISLSDLVATTPTSLKIVNMPESASRLARVQEMLTWERREVGFSTVAANPDALTSARRLSMLSMLSAEWFTSTSSWSAAVDSYVKDTKGIVTSVQVEKSSTITLLADQTSVPVTVSNNLDQSVTVYLGVRPTTTVISVDSGHRFESVTIAANSQRRVQIPIQSLTNRKAFLAATLYDGKKKAISRTVLLSLNVQAGWETFGTSLFFVVIVAVFAFGIIRNIRRRRKATREATEADAA